jgi:hypothetical protein
MLYTMYLGFPQDHLVWRGRHLRKIIAWSKIGEKYWLMAELKAAQFWRGKHFLRGHFPFIS